VGLSPLSFLRSRLGEGLGSRPHLQLGMVGNLLGDPMQDVVIGGEVQAVFEDHPDKEATLVQWEVVG
jgi:hypothetical protein